MNSIYTLIILAHVMKILKTFKSGFPYDLIIKTLKWLFIEQDIRYWNYSGHDMLWKGIYNINHTI